MAKMIASLAILLLLGAFALSFVVFSPAEEPPKNTTLPDLVFLSAFYQLDTGNGCSAPPYQMGVGVYFQNVGSTTARNFQVEVNGLSQTVASLDPNSSIRLWFSTDANVTVTLDPDNQIAEVDEANNTFAGMLPIPTLPPPCMPT